MSELIEQYLLRALKLFQQGRYDDSLGQLRLAQAAAPAMPELRLQAGIVLLEAFSRGAGESYRQEARKEFRAALRLRPGWQEAEEWLAKSEEESRE